MTNLYYNTIKKIKKYGEHFPKKHGDWYRVKVLNAYVLLDTYNGRISVHRNKCEPSEKDIYGGIVTFYYDDYELLAINFGEYKETKMLNFWSGHIGL